MVRLRELKREIFMQFEQHKRLTIIEYCNCEYLQLLSVYYM